MYRRALAASWAAQSGELPADQCIEDIFSGGDGWKDGYKKTSVLRVKHDENRSEEDQHLQKHRRNVSGTSTTSQTRIKGSTTLGQKHQRSRDLGGALRDQSPSEQASSENSERGRTGFRHAHEVDEFEMRDDLVAWKLPGKVSA